MTRPVCITCGQTISQEIEGEVIPPSHHARKGAGTHFTQAIGDQICGLLAQGLSLMSICSMEGMPDTTTIYAWRRRFPSFSLAYAQAREDAADAFADEILAIADDRSDDWKLDETTNTWKPDHDIVNRAKLRVDARKWIAAKLKPATYSDRVEARISGTVEHKHAHAALVIDAASMSAEERQMLRAAIIPRLTAQADEPEDDA